MMTGELFEVNQDTLRIVSLDGHRLSIRKVLLKDTYENAKVIVPGKTLSEVSKILTGDNEKEVLIYFGANHILFEFDDTVVVSRLIEGEYFRVDQMLSNDYTTKLTVNKKEFLDCIERASILVRENDKKPIIFTIEDSKMSLKLNSSFGTMNAEILIHKTGQDLMIGFNPKFLSDALRVIDDEEVTLYMMNAKSPCFIKDEEENYIYLVLPVNFNAAAYKGIPGNGIERKTMEIIHLRDEFIKLGQALKLAGLAESGLDAKEMIQEGLVKVNGEVETRRGRKLYPGDTVSYDGSDFQIEK